MASGRPRLAIPSRLLAIAVFDGEGFFDAETRVVRKN
jgi:hypothetical protein